MDGALDEVMNQWRACGQRSKDRPTQDIVVGVCRPSHQQEKRDKAFIRRVEKASQSQALVLLCDFNHNNIYWKANVAGHKQSRFLGQIKDNFLI